MSHIKVYCMLLKEYGMLLSELTRVAREYDHTGAFVLFILLRVFSHENLVLFSFNNGSDLVYLRCFSCVFCCPGLLPNCK